MTTIAPMNSTAVALSNHPFLSSIPIGSLRRLAAHVHHHTYAAGEQVFREGEIANRFFLIRQGLVRLDLEIADRGQVEVETLGPDAALGWSWLFSPCRWRLTATAIERTSVLVFDTDALQTVMASDPPLGYELMRRFSAVIFDRLIATRQQLTGDADVASTGAAGPWAGKRTQRAAVALIDAYGRVVPTMTGPWHHPHGTFVATPLRYWRRASILQVSTETSAGSPGSKEGGRHAPQDF